MAENCETPPRSRERGYEAKTRKRTRVALAIIVLLVIVLNIFLFLKFGLRSGPSEGPPINKSPVPPR